VDTARMSRLSAGQQSACQQFSEFTSAAPDVAAKCLRRHGWNVQMALSEFWDNPGAFSPPPPACDVAAVEKLFEKYKDEGENCIGVDGLVQMCEDLDEDPTDIRMLLFCHALKVKTAVNWTRAEFMEGMVRLGYDSIAKVKAGFPTLQSDMLEPHKFKAFYAFAFDVSRQEGQKVLDLQTAVGLWRLLLKGKFKHLEMWCGYIETEFKKSIAKDTYLLTLDFALQANDDFSNIDLDSSAWPVVIDEFVEFGRKALAPGGGSS